jgi:NAD(P)-dependent dehydrogenase (short-subunit alcohol dehydrogenase family)
MTPLPVVESFEALNARFLDACTKRRLAILRGHSTPIGERMQADMAAFLHGPDVAATAFAAETGIARYGVPEDIAELIAFLVSPGARWMTGSTLRMDGGEIKSV